MAYLPHLEHLKRVRSVCKISRLKDLSPVQVKACAALLMLLLCLEAYFFWLPSYQRYLDMQQKAGSPNQLSGIAAVNSTPNLPASDKLLEIVEACRSNFSRISVEVLALNLERFVSQEEGKGSAEGIDYALVRLQLKGDWQTIVAGFETLEETHPEINVQELTLADAGGEGLLQIYVRTEK